MCQPGLGVINIRCYPPSPSGANENIIAVRWRLYRFQNGQATDGVPENCSVEESFDRGVTRVGIGILGFSNISEACNGTVVQCEATFEGGSTAYGVKTMIICEGKDIIMG